MKREDFLLLLQNPAGSDIHSDLLREMVVRFPYCQSTQVLFAIQLAKAGSLEFNHQLRKAAAYSSNRKKLRQFITLVQKEEHDQQISLEKIDEHIITENQIKEPYLPLIKEAQSEQVADAASHRMTLLDIVNKRLAEIEKEQQQAKSPQVDNPPESNPLKVDAEQEDQRKGLTKEEIIEKFMREEPRISRPKIEFFSPSEKAFRSGISDDEIVSETLAQLYYQQGDIQKTKLIYQKLSLLFPEKSSYFAAQIEKLG